MSARDKLYAYAGTPSVLPESMLDEALDDYRAEVAAATRREDAAHLLAVSREHATRAIYCDAIRDCARRLQKRADEGAAS